MVSNGRVFLRETVSTDGVEKRDIVFQDIRKKTRGNMYTKKQLFMPKDRSEISNIRTATCNNRGNAENADTGTEKTDKLPISDSFDNITP